MEASRTINKKSVENDSVGTAEGIAIGIFGTLGILFCASITVVVYKIAAHRKKTNNEIFRQIKEQERLEAERLQKIADEELAKALQKEDESENDSSELGDEVPQIAVSRLPEIVKKKSESSSPGLPSIHKQRSIKQSQEMFYDPNYDIEKDEQI